MNKKPFNFATVLIDVWRLWISFAIRWHFNLCLRNFVQGRTYSFWRGRG